MADVNDLTEDSPKNLSRRNVIAGAAWGAPIVLGVGLAPTVAASTSKDMNAVVVTQAPSVGNSGAQGTIYLWYAAVFYDANLWAHDPCPDTAQVTWEVVVKNALGEEAGTLVKRTDVLAKWGTGAANSGSVTGLPAGGYSVVCRILSVVYNPNPVSGVTFKTTNSPSKSSSITVI